MAIVGVIDHQHGIAFAALPGSDRGGREIEMEEVDVKPQGMAQGGKAVKTPGTFSHKTNPIDVMKDGKKIAEMTGGEYIFNPKQSETMRNLSKNGNSALHKFVRDLLSKRQFK